jgi:hypothetical protein
MLHGLSRGERAAYYRRRAEEVRGLIEELEVMENRVADPSDEELLYLARLKEIKAFLRMHLHHLEREAELEEEMMRLEGRKNE